MLGSFMKKIGSALTSASEKDAAKTLGITNANSFTKEFGEAVIAACCLTAGADGSIDDDEVGKIVNMLDSDPELEKLGSDFVNMTMERYVKMLKAAFTVNKTRMLNEIREGMESPGSDKAKVLVGYMVEVAIADGEIGEKEVAVINQVARMVGVDAKEFLATAA